MEVFILAALLFLFYLGPISCFKLDSERCLLRFCSTYLLYWSLHYLMRVSASLSRNRGSDICSGYSLGKSASEIYLSNI